MKFLSAICLLVILASCQTDIEKELEYAPFEKTSISESLDKASELRLSAPEEAADLALESLEFSTQYDDWQGQLRACSILANIYLTKLENPEKAHFYLELYQKTAKKYESFKSLFRYYYNKGATLYAEKKYPSALEYFLKAKALLPHGEDDKTLSAIYYGIGLVKCKTFQYEEAKEYLNKASVTAKKANYAFILTSSLEQLGNIHLWEGDIETSNDFYIQSAKIAAENKFYEEAADGSNALAYNYLMQGKNDKAYLLLMEGYEYAKQGNSLREEAKTNLFLSLYYQKINDSKKGIEKLAEAQKVFFEIDDRELLLQVYSRQIELYSDLGELAKAKNAAEQGLAYIADGEKIDSDEFFQNARTLFESTGNEADIFRFKYEQANLELDRRRRNDMVGMMQVQAEHEEEISANRLDLDKAALSLEQAKVEKLNLTRGLVVAFLLLLIVAGVSLSVGFVNNFRASNDLRKLSKDFLTNSSEILQKYSAGEKM